MDELEDEWPAVDDALAAREEVAADDTVRRVGQWLGAERRGDAERIMEEDVRTLGGKYLRGTREFMA